MSIITSDVSFSLSCPLSLSIHTTVSFSPAATSLHHHILVVFQDDLLVFIQVEQGDGAEVSGHTTGSGDVRVD